MLYSPITRRWADSSSMEAMLTALLHIVILAVGIIGLILLSA